MKPTISLFLCAVLLSLNCQPSDGAVIATHFDSSHNTSSAAGSGAEFDSGSVTVFVDPAQTSWIGWNDSSSISYTHPSRPGEFFFGPGGIGVDDFIRLIVVQQQSGQSQSVDIDQNDGSAVSFGTQNLIYGTAADAPDAARDPGGFPGPPQFLNDSASHNSIFTEPGNYDFHFSFRNIYGSSAAHPDMWLLISMIPEPSAMTVLPALSSLVLLRRRTRACCSRNAIILATDASGS